MDNYKDLFINIDKFDEEKMSYIKPILFYKVSRNMGIYYKKEIPSTDNKCDKKKQKNKLQSENPILTKKFRKQKIIIQSPKMIVPFGIKEFDNNGKKTYQMSLSFSTMTNLYNEEDIKKFFFFIKKIDTINEDIISDNKKIWGLPVGLKYRKTLQRLSKGFPHHMNLNLPYDEKLGFLFHVYDEKATKSTIDIIKKKSIVSIVMELTDLKFTDKEYRSNWTVMQIRKFNPYSPIQEFFMTGCFICDEDDPEDTVYASLIKKYQATLYSPIVPLIPSYVPASHQSYTPNLSIPTPPPIPQAQPIQEAIFKPPTLEELLKTKNKLKKTNTVVKCMDGGRVLDNTEKPVSPKKIKKTDKVVKCMDEGKVSNSTEKTVPTKNKSKNKSKKIPKNSKN